MTAIAVTIAGSDSSGGAGIQADLKSFSALGIYGASVITALTAQNTLGVQGVHDVPPAFVAQQIDSVFSDLRVEAVKIGMLSQPKVIETVAAGLARHAAQNIVLDPVMIATSGDRLLAPEAVASSQDHADPASAPADAQPARGGSALERACRRRRRRYARAGGTTSDAWRPSGPAEGRPRDGSGERRSPHRRRRARALGIPSLRHTQHAWDRLLAVVCDRRRFGEGTSPSRRRTAQPRPISAVPSRPPRASRSAADTGRCITSTPTGETGSKRSRWTLATFLRRQRQDVFGHGVSITLRRVARCSAPRLSCFRRRSRRSASARR